MTDRVNATMHRLQPPSGQSVTDRPPTHPNPEQLAARHHAVLPLGQDPHP
jgi:hypothetical protein